MIAPARGFLVSIWSSVSSFQFYRTIQDQTFGRSMRYLFALAVCLSLLVSGRMYRDFSRSLEDWASWMSATIPDIRIKNGVAEVLRGQSRSITDDRAILIFDSSDGQTAKIDEKYRTGMILAKDKLVLKWNQTSGPSGGDVSRLEKFIYGVAYMAYLMNPQALHGNQYDLAGLPSLVINSQNIREWKEMAVRWMGAFLPFVYFVYYLAGKLLQALFFSLILAYSHRSAQKEFSYLRVLNIAMYALTPPALFVAVTRIAGLTVPYVEWIFLGMYVAFLLGAMKASKARNKPEELDAEEKRPDDWADF